jgi:hypothetical protein
MRPAFQVGYVVLCALSLLNFFLAIVVNGYTKVSENVLENKVVNSIGKDVLLVIRDLWVWPSNRWLSKAEILNVLARAFPQVFENGYAQADTYHEELTSREEFVDIFTTNSLAVQAVDKHRSRTKKGFFSRIVTWIGRRPWERRSRTMADLDVDEVERVASEVFDHYMRQFNRTVLVASRMSFDANSKHAAVAALQNDPGPPSSAQPSKSFDEVRVYDDDEMSGKPAPS